MTTLDAASRLSPLPAVARPTFAVFADFDESFFAREQTPETRRDMHALRHWFEANVTTHEILFGFITGSNIESVVEKLNRVPGLFLPHFVGASLGSEIHLADSGGLTLCQRFQASMCTETEFDGAISHLMHSIKARQYALDPQPPSNFAALKRSFYLHEPDEAKQQEFEAAVTEIADVCGLFVNCHQCNPSAGDPEGSLEVDITPKGAGKAAVVKHILQTHNIARSHAWAFGDSCNDLGMLRAVGNAFSLSNATADLKEVITNVTSRPYAGGILEVLRRVFG